jgi:hypothetical protein
MSRKGIYSTKKDIQIFAVHQFVKIFQINFELIIIQNMPALKNIRQLRKWAMHEGKLREHKDRSRKAVLFDELRLMNRPNGLANRRVFFS